MFRALKKSHIAILLSALIFPGVGHLYLKQRRKGLAFIAAVLFGLGVIVWLDVTYILRHVDTIMINIYSGTVKLTEILDAVRAEVSSENPFYDDVLYFVFFIWLFAFFDAYRVGRKLEFKNNDT